MVFSDKKDLVTVEVELSHLDPQIPQLASPTLTPGPADRPIRLSQACALQLDRPDRVLCCRISRLLHQHKVDVWGPDQLPVL